MERQKAKRELTLDLLERTELPHQEFAVIEDISPKSPSDNSPSGYPHGAAAPSDGVSASGGTSPKRAQGMDVSDKRWDDIPRRKDRRKIISASLGMVRSPAMHEGFRKELFTVERSPGNQNFRSLMTGEDCF